ncbi:MAG: IS1595 family transposase [Bacteroidota bacterium]
MRNSIPFNDFVKQFSDSRSCKEHLIRLKWSQGYTCRKCGHDRHVKGRTWAYRKCQHCHYDESCTAHTLFDKLKFPIESAFMMIYLITVPKKGISTCELARQFGVHQQTAWYFKRKVQQAMQSEQGDLLTGVVEVDETVVGGKEKNKQGRSYGKKHIIQLAVETNRGTGDGLKVKRVKARQIESYSSESLGGGLMSLALKGSFIVTDKFRAYRKATKGYIHIELLSESGKQFEKLHWMIFNLKNWIRGTHHRVSAMHVQRYLNEFCFRFNNRNYSRSALNAVFKAMVYSPWLPYKQAVGM